VSETILLMCFTASRFYTHELVDSHEWELRITLSDNIVDGLLLKLVSGIYGFSV
jgi:hypothetical protein